MPKIKTKKTALKRVKITKSGKIIKGKVTASHLKVKWNANKKFRKNKQSVLTNMGQKKIFRKLLPKSGIVL